MTNRNRVLEEAMAAVQAAAWKHLGDDAYSLGLDRGATSQLLACVNAIRALRTPAEPVLPEPSSASTSSSSLSREQAGMREALEMLLRDADMLSSTSYQVSREAYAKAYAALNAYDARTALSSFTEGNHKEKEMTDKDELIAAIATNIVACQGRTNRDRALAVLAEIEAQGWRVERGKPLSDQVSKFLHGEL